jgi:pimeloyl-ACP methyl ester carboxylesterase
MSTATAPARRTIVAIHGAGMTAAAWGGLAPHLLTHAFRPISLPGHDPRAGTEPLVSIAAMASWLREKLAGAPPASNVLVGHSMGALVALAAAADPSVCAVVLMGAAAKMPVNPELLKMAREQPNEAIGTIIKWGVDPAHTQVGAVRTVLGSLMHGVDPRCIALDLAACDAFAGGEQLARELGVPALVLSGQYDKLTKPAEGEKLAGLMKQAHYHLLTDCGHMMMIEQPIETAHEIKDFLSNLQQKEVASGGD